MAGAMLKHPPISVPWTHSEDSDSEAPSEATSAPSEAPSTLSRNRLYGSYTSEFILRVLPEYENQSPRSVASKYNINESTIRNWKTTKSHIMAWKQREVQKSRADGEGRRPLASDMEEKLYSEMVCGLYAVFFFLAAIPCSLSTPDPAAKSLDTLNINLNLGGDGKGGEDYSERQSHDNKLYRNLYAYRPGKTCPMDVKLGRILNGCQCGSERCKMMESCAKFNTSKSYRSPIQATSDYQGYFDRNCTTGHTNCKIRCKQEGKFCSGGDGYPISCTCAGNIRSDVEHPGMCETIWVRKMQSCACPDGKEITQHPDGKPFYAENVWLEPARDADD